MIAFTKQPNFLDAKITVKLLDNGQGIYTQEVDTVQEIKAAEQRLLNRYCQYLTEEILKRLDSSKNNVSTVKREICCNIEHIDEYASRMKDIEPILSELIPQHRSKKAKTCRRFFRKLGKVLRYYEQHQVGIGKSEIGSSKSEMAQP